MNLLKTPQAKCSVTSRLLAAWKLSKVLPQRGRDTMRTQSAKVLMRTQSADWRTKYIKSADWCNPVSDRLYHYSESEYYSESE